MPQSLGQGLASSTLQWGEADIRDGGSPRVCAASDGSSSVTRSFLFDWPDWKEAYWRILGYPAADASTTPNPTLLRYLPEVFPDLPWLVARKVEVKGVGPTPGGSTPELYQSPPGVQGQDTTFWIPDAPAAVAEYKKALLTVSYEEVGYDLLADDDDDLVTYGESARFTSWKFKPSAEFLTVPLGTWVWANDGLGGTSGQPVPFSQAKLVISGELSVTWHEVPESHVPWATINDCLGKVNKTDDYIPGPKKYAKDTLLLIAAEPLRHRSALGAWVNDVTYSFKILPSRHTYFYDYLNGVYRQVRRKPGGSVVADGTAPDGVLAFDERDLTKLFQIL